MKGFLRVEMSVTLISRIICYYMCVCTQFGKEREAVLLLRSVACCNSPYCFYIFLCGMAAVAAVEKICRHRSPPPLSFHACFHPHRRRLSDGAGGRVAEAAAPL